MTIYKYTAKNSYKTAYQGITGPSPVRFPLSGAPELGGNYKIVGTVDRLGLVGSYRVALFDRRRGSYIRETTSAANGAYSFTNLEYRANGYFVVAFDSSGTPLNAAIADLVTPEAM